MPNFYEDLIHLKFGSCCTPKFSLPYPSRFVKNHLQMIQGCSRTIQSNHLLRQLKLGIWFFQGIWGFQWLNQISYAYIHSQAPTCQVSRLPSASLHSQKLHLIYSQLQGQNGHFAVKSQNSWSTSYF